MSHVAAIHVMKANLVKAGAMNEDDYRALLEQLTRGPGQPGKRSCSSMTALELSRVRFHFDKLSVHYGLAKAQPKPPQGWQVKKIEDLWADLGKVPGALNDPSRVGLLAFVKTQAGVGELRFLDTKKAIKITEALKAWLKRVRAQ